MSRKNDYDNCCADNDNEDSTGKRRRGAALQSAALPRNNPMRKHLWSAKLLFRF